MGKFASSNHNMMKGLRSTDFDWDSSDYVTETAIAGIVLLALGALLLIAIPVTVVAVRK